jgi:hypothetical protein
LREDPYHPCYEEIYLYYPLPTRSYEVMPTRLGNILKNAELYPDLRYGVNSVLVWPRLYQLLPNHYLQTIAEARGSLDFMLVIATLSGIFALASSLYLWIVKAKWWLFLLCLCGGMVVAFWAYLGALQNAFLYAQVIKAGFDLYRYKLLNQMRLPLPTSPSQEQQLWQQVNNFLYRGIPFSGLHYTNNPPENSQDGEPS